MRVTGRLIGPSTLSERRLLLSLGSPTLRVPRSANPYVVARRLERAAKGDHPDVLFVCDVIGRPRQKATAAAKSPDRSIPDYGSAP